jgi:hypothetical protein
VVALAYDDAGPRAVERPIDVRKRRLLLREGAHRRSARFLAMDRFVAGHVCAIREVCG